MKRLAALTLLLLSSCAQPMDCEATANAMLKAGEPRIEALAFFMACVEKERK